MKDWSCGTEKILKGRTGRFYEMVPVILNLANRKLFRAEQHGIWMHHTWDGFFP